MLLQRRLLVLDCVSAITDFCCPTLQTLLANNWPVLPSMPPPECEMFCRLLHLAHMARMRAVCFEVCCLILLCFHALLANSWSSWLIPHAPTVVCVMFCRLLHLAHSARMQEVCWHTLYASSWLLRPGAPTAVCVMFCRLPHLAHTARIPALWQTLLANNALEPPMAPSVSCVCSTRSS